MGLKFCTLPESGAIVKEKVPGQGKSKWKTSAKLVDHLLQSGKIW